MLVISRFRGFEKCAQQMLQLPNGRSAQPSQLSRRNEEWRKKKPKQERNEKKNQRTRIYYCTWQCLMTPHHFRTVIYFIRLLIFRGFKNVWALVEYSLLRPPPLLLLHFFSSSFDERHFEYVMKWSNISNIRFIFTLLNELFAERSKPLAHG